jgi:hypothetical protein
MTPTDRNSLLADVLEEVALAAESWGHLEVNLRKRAQALRSTPERAEQRREFEDVPSLHGVVRDHFSKAEQPAGGLVLYVAEFCGATGKYQRSPEAEAVIAALMPLRDNLRKDGYRGLVGLINALDRKHRGQS